LSPDGTRIALDIRDQQNDIWVWDIARKGLMRLTDNPASDNNPAWSSDGRRIAFGSARDKPGLYWQFADGTGTAEPLAFAIFQNPRDFTSDDTRLITTGNDVVSLLSIDGKRQPEVLLRGTGTFNAELSPDEKWLAYDSSESGRAEVHVRPFPNVNGGHWQVTNGGTRPLWAPSGRELFYRAIDDGMMMSVAVQASVGFGYGTPVKLFSTAPYHFAANGRTYDVSLDGKKLLMIKNAAADPAANPGATATVVLNWFEELKARVP
jgi:Tol biopolymer transport system component